MANVLYPTGKAALLTADIDFSADTIRAALIDTGTVSYNAAHDFFDDISTGVVGTPVALASITTTLGVVDCADITWTGVSGSTVEAVVFYKWTGVAGTSQLIAWFDTGVTGLTLTPNGGDVTATIHASGLFAL